MPSFNVEWITPDGQTKRKVLVSDDEKTIRSSAERRGFQVLSIDLLDEPESSDACSRTFTDMPHPPASQSGESAATEGEGRNDESASVEVHAEPGDKKKSGLWPSKLKAEAHITMMLRFPDGTEKTGAVVSSDPEFIRNRLRAKNVKVIEMTLDDGKVIYRDE